LAGLTAVLVDWAKVDPEQTQKAVLIPWSGSWFCVEQAIKLVGDGDAEEVCDVVVLLLVLETAPADV
jgi:hypothetical protein